MRRRGGEKVVARLLVAEGDRRRAARWVVTKAAVEAGRVKSSTRGRQRALWEWMRNRGVVRFVEVREAFGMGNGELQERLRRLERYGLAVRVGWGRYAATG